MTNKAKQQQRLLNAIKPRRPMGADVKAYLGRCRFTLNEAIKLAGDFRKAQP